MRKPSATPLLDDIQEVNLAYLHIVRRAIAESRLDILGGMSTITRDWIAALTPADLARVSRSSVMMCCLTGNTADLLGGLSQSLQTLILDRQSVAALAAP